MSADWPLDFSTSLLLMLLGYVFGSVPFGLLVTRMAGLGDIRSIGSGNIGTTNVLRTGSKKLAALTLVLDAAKGTIPVLFAARWGPAGAALVGVAALLGHLFPIWLNFKGGKGVATFLGIMFGFAWPLGLIFIAAWIAAAFLTRYSSVGGISATALTAAACVAFYGGWPATAAVFMGVIVIIAHRENIARLARGEETKIKFGR
ncbi:glycerol-3-phosphate acyltransferase PlsY [Rhodoligotrophos appendicifer]|uniref:glycerol-3-phosphate 1-O-acyltransferase PlsY n=1 Tax=Rhodoligotrophos appendicifer TaxID=987056 RepID=UPI0011871F24|nr:glycerol-3-phosphate 1-O-acyltransferase PlsY [Rhodoligotrophos appendicifer]